MIDTYKRLAKITELHPYCYLSDKNDYLEVTEWFNGEGFDVTLGLKGGDEKISLTWGQWDALQAVVAYKGEPHETS